MNTDELNYELVRGVSRSYYGDVLGQHYWLRENGVVVGHINILWSPSEQTEKLTLCDIEVRGGYRGRGLAVRMIRMVEAIYNETLYTTGSYTTDGHRAFSGKLPLRWGAYETLDPISIDFVKDWDTMEPMFQL